MTVGNDYIDKDDAINQHNNGNRALPQNVENQIPQIPDEKKFQKPTTDRVNNKWKPTPKETSFFGIEKIIGVYKFLFPNYEDIVILVILVILIMIYFKKKW